MQPVVHVLPCPRVAHSPLQHSVSLEQDSFCGRQASVVVVVVVVGAAVVGVKSHSTSPLSTKRRVKTWRRYIGCARNERSCRLRRARRRRWSGGISTAPSTTASVAGGAV